MSKKERFEKDLQSYVIEKVMRGSLTSVTESLAKFMAMSTYKKIKGLPAEEALRSIKETIRKMGVEDPGEHAEKIIQIARKHEILKKD